MEEPSPILSLPARYRLASARVLEYRILGPLEVLEDGRPIALAGPQQRAALAILLLSANRVVSIEQFADDLYAGAPPVTAVTQVQRQVSELRKVIGPDTIETRSPGFLLHAEPAAVHLGRFESLTGEAAQALARGDAQAASDLYVESLDLWRGAPLAELTYDSFAQPAIGRLEEMRLAALEQRFDADLELGRHSDVIGELEALIWDHPLRERFRVQMMLALYRAGRQAEALRPLSPRASDPGRGVRHRAVRVASRARAADPPPGSRTRKGCRLGAAGGHGADDPRRPLVG